MQKCILSLLCAAILFGSCQNTPKAETVAEATQTPDANPTPQTTCYEMRQGPDITAIEMTVNGEDMSGFYAWEPDQKDGGRGMLKGKKVGDQITANFTYMIEGSIQSEEVMFKIAGDKLMKANGELEDKAGLLVIKDKTKLTFEETFSSTDCAKIKESIDRAKLMSEMISKEKGK